MLKLIPTFFCFFIFIHLALSSEDKEYDFKVDFENHFETIEYFHQYILPLDSSIAISQLCRMIQGTKVCEERIILANAWIGMYLQHKNNAKYESQVSFLQKAFALSENCKLFRWSGILSNYLGYALLSNKKYKAAAEYLLLSAHQIEDEGYAKFYEADLYLFNIARMYFEFHKYPESITYLQKALRFTKKGSKIEQYALNLMGICYAELNDFENATNYLEKTKNNVLNNKDSSGIAAMDGNLGILYSHQQNFKIAEPLLQKALKYNYNHENWKSATTNTLWLVENFISTNNLLIAEKLLNSAKSLIKEKNQKDIEIRGLFYRTSSHFFQALGQYERAFLYLDSTNLIKEKISEARNVGILSDISIQLINEKHLIELELLQKQKDHEKSTRNLTILFLCVVTLFLLYLWLSILKKRKREKLQYQKERKRRVAELLDFKNRVKSKNKMLENVKKQLATFYSKNQGEEKAKAEMVQQLSLSVILTEEDWQKFKNLFERVYPDFLIKVQKEFPDLTVSELRLLTLLKLNLSISEMANMLAILPESVRKTRQRLMKKLEISFHKELRNFVLDL